MKRNYKIYMHKNKINGKVYIGQTYTSLRVRFGKNGIKYKSCPIFYYAIQKYGWDNFEHVILEENISDVEIANEREKYYIALYNSTDRNFGYNIQSGGNEQTGKSQSVVMVNAKVSVAIDGHIINTIISENIYVTLIQEQYINIHYLEII